MEQKTTTDFSEVIAENFGANASYVEGLLTRFRSNPNLVDESWRAYFKELLGDSESLSQTQVSDNGRSTAPPAIQEPAPPSAPGTAVASAPANRRWLHQSPKRNPMPYQSAAEH